MCHQADHLVAVDTCFEPTTISSTRHRPYPPACSHSSQTLPNTASSIATTLFFPIWIDTNSQIACCLGTESISARPASHRFPANDGIFRTDKEVVELLQPGRHPGQRVGPTAFGTGTKWSQSRIRTGTVAGTDAIARAHAIATIAFAFPQRDGPRVA